MSCWPKNLRTNAIGLVWLCALSTAQAGPVPATNNTPGTATVLTSGTLIVSDDLNGNAGRPATILGAFDDSRYQTLLASDVNSSVLGNGHASQLVGMSLRSNGSAYFRVTGAPDVNFTGQQTQFGSYSYQFDIFDSQHNHIESLSPEFENVAPGTVDNIWLEESSDPRRIGGTVNVTLNNIIGPGTGDSRDFFLFVGLQPFQEFTARMDAATFPAMIGVFNSSNVLVTQSNPLDPTATLSGQADALGRVLIGVTGAPDSAFAGQHAEVGTYTLEVLPVIVPEPSTAALTVLGVISASCWYRRRHKRSAE